MQKHRDKTNLKDLTTGPGKLCKAMDITKLQDGIDLTSSDSEVFIAELPENLEKEVISSTRVGISKSKEMELRFCIKGNPYISKK